MQDPTFFDRAPFVLEEGDYRVLDGDTLQVMTRQRDALGDRVPGERIRFRAIATPEKRKRQIGDDAARAAGYDPNANCPGHRAARQLRAFCKKRAILVRPALGTDKYGRMLADVCVFPGASRRCEDAISLEQVMLARGVATRFGDELIPPLHPFRPAALSTRAIAPGP